MNANTEVVATRIADGIGYVILQNPPVNAASQALRAGLVDAVERMDADPDVSVIVIYGDGRTFIAGADITEFGKPMKSPGLPEVCRRIEKASTSVVAVLHGTALGGGLEVAMAAHARVAVPGTRVGLPEIHLGLYPGAGGTQRGPRLMGWAPTIDMILTGRQVGADEAAETGLIDVILDGTPAEAAEKAGRMLQSGDLHTRRTCDINVPADPEFLAEARAKAMQKMPHLLAPERAFDALECATGDIDAGCTVERDGFMECLGTDGAKGMIHAFFADRTVQHIPEKGATPRSIERVGVIGGGTMGSGIGTAMLLAGLPLTLIETSDAGVEKARATIIGNLDGAVSRGKMKAAAYEAAVNDLLTVTTDFAALASADLIVEAVFEEMDIKKQVFTKLDEVAKDGAILATNTSYLDVNEIAAVTRRPQDVIGLHFFSPAHIMRLLEVVVAEKTGADVVATGFALAKRLHKIAVRAGVCDGFIGNRILNHYGRENLYLIEDGASPEQIDNALEAFGFAMGPSAVMDLAGLDIGWAARKRRAATRPPEERYVEIPDLICERGWFGRKTGQGYYIYDGKTRRPNPEVAEIIAAERARKGITPRDMTDQEIVDRYMTAMILEAARVVEDGTALRPIDVDAVLLNGYGFPRFRGGPLHYADTLGAAEVVKRADTYAKDDAVFWAVPPILRKMAEDGSSFAALNER
ncbi:3-hydroxyacyl-CoA dehydrogenase NAD-binding domain-containing protein [Halovulum sp. GXIMD14793]